MSTTIYFNLCKILNIEPSDPISDSVFNEMPSEDELFDSFKQSWNSGPSWNKGMNDSGMKGKKHSEETKKKMSKSRVGQRNALGATRSKETRQKIANANIGKKRDHIDWSTNKLRGNNRTESQKRQAKEHSERMKDRSAYNRKKIVFRGIEFDAVTHAMKYFNLSSTSFYNELRNN